MATDDDIDKLIDWARSQGWEVKPDAKGYRRFYDPRGTYITRYPATPGRARRRYLDVLTDVRSAGLPWPPPSKKDLRSQRRKEGQQ